MTFPGVQPIFAGLLLPFRSVVLIVEKVDVNVTVSDFFIPAIKAEAVPGPLAELKSKVRSEAVKCLAVRAKCEAGLVAGVGGADPKGIGFNHRSLGGCAIGVEE